MLAISTNNTVPNGEKLPHFAIGAKYISVFGNLYLPIKILHKDCPILYPLRIARKSATRQTGSYTRFSGIGVTY